MYDFIFFFFSFKSLSLVQGRWGSTVVAQVYLKPVFNWAGFWTFFFLYKPSGRAACSWKGCPWLSGHGGHDQEAKCKTRVGQNQVQAQVLEGGDWNTSGVEHKLAGVEDDRWVWSLEVVFNL